MFGSPPGGAVLEQPDRQLRELVEALFESGDEVSRESLARTAIGKSRYDVLKILGDGQLTKKLTVSADRFSKSAREKIEKAGGTIVELPAKQPVVKNKQKSAS